MPVVLRPPAGGDLLQSPSETGSPMNVTFSAPITLHYKCQSLCLPHSRGLVGRTQALVLLLGLVPSRYSMNAHRWMRKKEQN